MYGSYGSYSAISAMNPSPAMDIGHSRSSASCAFPSWPSRSSLTADGYNNASSYLSDEDLDLGGSFEDDNSSTTSSRSGSNASSISPPHRFHHHYQPQAPYVPADRQPEEQQQHFVQPTLTERVVSEDELLQLQRERQAYQCDVMRALVAEKERRKQAAQVARRQQRRAAAAAGAPVTVSRKKAKLAAIAESGSA